MYVSSSRNQALIHVTARLEYVEFLDEIAHARELKRTALDMESKSPMLLTMRASGLNFPSRG